MALSKIFWNLQYYFTEHPVRWCFIEVCDGVFIKWSRYHVYVTMHLQEPCLKPFLTRRDFVRLFLKILQKLGRASFWLLICTSCMKSHPLTWIWSPIGVYTTVDLWSFHPLTRFVTFQQKSCCTRIVDSAFQMCVFIGSWSTRVYYIWVVERC